MTAPPSLADRWKEQAILLCRELNRHHLSARMDGVNECRWCPKIAHALALAAEEACGKTEGGYYSHTDALQAVKAWIAELEPPFPPGFGTVEDIVDRALEERKEV